MPDSALNAESFFPSITASDLHKSIKFYTEGLGFEIVDKSEVDGELHFVMLKAGGAQVGIGQDDFKKGRDRQKGVGLRCWLSTGQDIPAIAARVKAAGFSLDAEPHNLAWGPLAFEVSDPDGFKITVVSPR
jgi:catechol 2,3-dioxygenase-like lactoylglutathione lyase family enzyme